MEEKILQELKEIKEMLRIIVSNTEQKEIKLDTNLLAKATSGILQEELKKYLKR